MVNCFGCGELVNPRDKFCRWCGRTIAVNEYQQRQPGAVITPVRHGKQRLTHILANGQLCPQCHPTGRVDDTEHNDNGLSLVKRLMRDEIEEYLASRIVLKDPAGII